MTAVAALGALSSGHPLPQYMNIRGLRHHSFDSWRAHRVQRLCSHMWCCLWCDHCEVRSASAVPEMRLFQRPVRCLDIRRLFCLRAHQDYLRKVKGSGHSVKVSARVVQEVCCFKYDGRVIFTVCTLGWRGHPVQWLRLFDAACRS